MKKQMVRSSKSVLILVFFISGFLLLNLPAQDDFRGGDKRDRDPLDTVVTKPDIKGYVRSRAFYKFFDHKKKHVKSTPKFLLPYIGHYLVSKMDDLNEAKVLNYDHEPGTHNLSIVAGRSVWFFEAAFDVELPIITNDTSKKKVQNIKSNARKHLKTFVKKLRKNEKEKYKDSDHEKRISQLRKQFKDKIIPGISKKHAEYKRSMLALFDQWTPIGKKVEDMTTIIGENPEKKQENLYVYNFDSGLEWWGFFLKTDDQNKIKYVYIDTS